MKFAPLTLPSSCAHRLVTEITKRLTGAGNVELLAKSLLGLLSSREFPACVLLETLDCVPQWVKQGRVILSGFHAPPGTTGHAIRAAPQGPRGEGVGAGYGRFPPDSAAAFLRNGWPVYAGLGGRIHRNTQVEPVKIAEFKIMDPDDVVFYATALAAECQFVTGNTRDYPQSGPVEMLTPRKAVERLSGIEE